ncbi:NACHT domain-containing protein [Leptolyngbya sp. NK1-12]|uniref:NACHT domain-containing protein n=1 Tax=Leptolyngbya sp. NK1-12 TaxID=2547451 RepID=A0AA96WI56_9CYAN|nr:NACHT domain-containing protein [Leptolyngbya sp. NK1-12]
MILEEALAVVTQALNHQRLTKVQNIIFRQAWEGKSYIEMGVAFGYDPAYLKDEGAKLWQLLSQACGTKVTKINFPTVLAQYAEAQQAQAQQAEANQAEANQAEAQQEQSILPEISTDSSRRIDWGEAINVSSFLGRETELATLKYWLLQNHCRLATILGMGGMGKTALSVKLAQQVQFRFERVIWRSLRDAPPLTELLTTLIQFLAPDPDSTLPVTETTQLAYLMDALRANRCLLILDNYEALFQAGQQTGTYRQGYEGYRELLQRIGQGQHQSSLVLTSREKPTVVAALQGENMPVRVLNLAGLPQADAARLLQAKGLSGSAAQVTSLVQSYQGNPLALMITATSIQDLCGGRIDTFLQQQTTVFNGVRNLLQQQINRLSELETKIMYWIAINREAVTVQELQADLAPFVPMSRLLEAVESLYWRSLIEKSDDGFTQQPVIMEYMTEQLIEGICQEILDTKTHSATEPHPFAFLKNYALLKASAKDYIRDSQARLILEPIAQQISIQFSPQELLERVNHLLSHIRQTNASNYAAGNLINLLAHLRIDLTGADFSRLKIWQADLSNLNLHHVNFTQADLSKSIFAETFGGILATAFSLDGTLLATSDSNGGIQVWQVGTGQRLVALTEGRAPWVWSVAFNPTQPNLLASCSDDTYIKLWNVETGKCLRVLSGHTSSVHMVAFSPNGQLLASGSEDGTIKLWQVSEPSAASCIATLEGHQGWVWSIAFSPDGQTLVSGSVDQTLKLWNVATGICEQTWIGHTDWIKSVAFSPDGKWIASGSTDRTIKLWQIETGQCLKTLQGHQDTVTAVAFSPASQQLVSSSYDQTIKLWQISSGECTRTIQGHSNRVWWVTFSPDGQSLASGGDDHAVRVWDIHTGRCSKTWKGHTNGILCLAAHTTQHLLASGHEDETIQLWDIQTGEILRTLRGHTHRVWSVAFAPQSLAQPLLASSSGDRTVKLWNWQTGQCLNTLRGHTSWVWTVTFSPDGKRLVSSSVDGLVKLWDTQTGKCIETLQEHKAAVVRTIFSPDERTLISGGFDQTIKIWDSATGTCLRTLEGHQGTVWSVLFWAQNQQLISGSFDQTIKFWDIKTGQCLRTLTGHQAAIVSLALSADRHYLASSSFDQTIKLWDLETGECVRTFAGHTGIVTSIIFFPTVDLQNQTDLALLSETDASELLISISYDETIKFWDTTTGTCIHSMQTPRPYEGMTITRATGLTEAQRATLKALGASEADPHFH